MPPSRLLVGPFEVDLQSGELRFEGQRVALQEKPFQLLSALLKTPGKLVSRATLRETLWPDVFVDFDGNLNAAVKKLREALGDSATDPSYIETVPRRGYRLIAPVRPAADEPSSIPSPSEAQGRARGLRVSLLAAVGFVVSLAAAWTAAEWLRPNMPAESARSATEERVMLAVLPFDNLSGDADLDYLSDGMTEELLTVLGRLQPERLGVIARITAMTYKGTTKPIAEIGRELGVSYVLEGSVRGSDQRTRVTAQLIATADQTHLWAESYDAELDDLLRVETEIARRIAQALTLELLEDPLVAASLATLVPEAYDHYLRGRHQWNRFSADGYRSAIAELSKAIELDPSYAQAHAALADAYNLNAFEDDGSPTDGFAHARASAQRALAIAPDLAEAHNSLAFAILYGDFDPAAADPIFRRAQTLAPNYAMSYHWHAGALAALGRHEEAIAAVRQALELDPLSLSVKSDLGWYYLFAQRWEDAARECQATLEMSPGYGWAVTCLFEARLQAGRTEDSVRIALDQLRSSGEDLSEAPGQSPEATLNAILEHHLKRELDKDNADALWRTILYARLGQHEAAIEWLTRAVEQREPWLVFLSVDPRFASIRQHPRFQTLLDSL